jgi:hypothetical protein
MGLLSLLRAPWFITGRALPVTGDRVIQEKGFEIIGLHKNLKIPNPSGMEPYARPISLVSVIGTAF